ncbi:MAG: hypothetical protein ACREX6_02125 [Casimicrobiaceae bacterium]
MTDVADPSMRWHLEIAKTCNNRAWELSVRQRSPAEDREMLDAAHTSAWHWAKVGNEQNRMRATMLVAEVHALLGHGATALALAAPTRDYFVNRADTPDWELALAHMIVAHGAHAAGDTALHRSAYREAADAIARVAGDEDRRIVLETFDNIPRP